MTSPSLFELIKEFTVREGYVVIASDSDLGPDSLPPDQFIVQGRSGATYCIRVERVNGA